jgi:hypothetical protein
MEEALQLVDSLAVRLQAPAEVVWRAYLVQATVSGITVLAYAVILLGLIGMWLGVWVPKLWRSAQDANDETGHIMAITIGSILSLLGLLYILIETPFAITALVNPEYWAIQRILGR